MGYNAPLCASRTRAHTSISAYGHAMPCGLITPTSITWIGNDVFLFALGDIFMAKGISVPISRGGPPLSLE